MPLDNRVDEYTLVVSLSCIWCRTIWKIKMLVGKFTNV